MNEKEPIVFKTIKDNTFTPFNSDSILFCCPNGHEYRFRYDRETGEININKVYSPDGNKMVVSPEACNSITII